MDCILSEAEVRKLQSDSRELEVKRGEIQKLKEKLDKYEELDRLLFPIACSERWAEIKGEIKELSEMEAAEGYFHWYYRDQLAEYRRFIEKPQAEGYTILCTYDDLGADSGSNNSRYALFILVSDGRVILVQELGLYGGAFGTRIQSMKDVLTRKLPYIEASKISERAPQCYETAKALSDATFQN